MNKVLSFIEKNSQKLIWLGIVLYALIFSIILICKYNAFLYNGLDLGIINNVFYNTLQGNWFWSSLQGHSYLGDHFTPILILILPIYFMWQSPEMLLILQSIFLGLAAWPIYKISQLVLKDNKLSLSLGLLWLINPLAHNINLFEFHFISLTPLIILMVFYCYLKLKENIWAKKYLIGWFVFLLLALMIREDIAFIILVFLLILLFNNLKDKKILKLVSYGLGMSAVWIVISTKIISHFSPSNFSPFSYYYAWLTNTDIGSIISHILSLHNFEMLVGLLLPFLFIPLIKPKWLLIALIPLAQIIFSATGGGALIWQMHYGAIFLPAIILTFIFSFKKANGFVENKLKSKWLLIIVLLIVNIYAWQDLGPFELRDKSKQELNQLVELIDDDNSAVLGSYRFLANLSSRENIYALHYYFLNQQQFGAGEYKLKQEPEYILIDFQDLVSFNIHLKNLTWSKDHYPQGDNRLRELLKNYGVVKVLDDVVLFRKNYPGQIKLYEINKEVESKGEYVFDDKIELVDYIFDPQNGNLEVSFRALKALDKDYQLLLESEENKKILPLAWGLYPTTEWQVDEIIKVNYWLDMNKDINLSLIELYGGMEIGKMGVVKRVIDQEIAIGEKIKIN